MAKLTVLAAAPTAAPEALPGSVEITSSPALDVRLKTTAAAGAAAGVRPHFWMDGTWWPLGKDAVTGVGVAPVTAGAAGAKAHGRYTTHRIVLPWCLVLEGGALADIESAYLDAAERE